MTPLLTTITPYWNRPEMLTVWLRSICAVPHPEVCHLLLCVGPLPDWLHSYANDSLLIYPVSDVRPSSIGVYHNLGARLAETEWIMKFDVDCIGHTHYFKELVDVLKQAPPHHWYNGGMFYLDRSSSSTHAAAGKMPLTAFDYYRMSDYVGTKPLGGSNFICRRKDYLDLGGCDSRFSGWGWEDYQQIYMLEHHQTGTDPLPGDIDESNVTQRCRDEISRRKIKELITINDRLGLLHRWHPPSTSLDYRNAAQSAANRRILLEYIYARRRLHFDEI